MKIFDMFLIMLLLKCPNVENSSGKITKLSVLGCTVCELKTRPLFIFVVSKISSISFTANMDCKKPTVLFGAGAC
jgi:hypothetical protein